MYPLRGTSPAKSSIVGILLIAAAQFDRDAALGDVPCWNAEDTDQNLGIVDGAVYVRCIATAYTTSQ